MKLHQDTLVIPTRGRGTIEITASLHKIAAASGVEQGICHVFVHHTSASLLIGENADPGVRRDLERFLARLVPDGDPLFEHTLEGPDDMPAHVRSILTATTLTIPIRARACDLGTWQGVYLYEHRTEWHRRRITVNILGE